MRKTVGWNGGLAIFRQTPLDQMVVLLLSCWENIYRSKVFSFSGGQHDKMVVKVSTSGSSLDSIFHLGGCRVCVLFLKCF